MSVLLVGDSHTFDDVHTVSLEGDGSLSLVGWGGEFIAVFAKGLWVSALRQEVSK